MNMKGLRSKPLQAGDRVVMKVAGEPYFANVDVEVAPRHVVRARPLHSQIKRVNNSAQQ